MKIRWRLLGALLIASLGIFVLFHFKSEETIVSATYQMLACERCYHMTVERSNDSSRVGTTIIPMSDKVNIEQMIDGMALTKQPICLRGKFYLLNINLFKINPDGQKFQVISLEDSEACSAL